MTMTVFLNLAIGTRKCVLAFVALALAGRLASQAAADVVVDWNNVMLGNAATDADPNWLPLLTTPPYPSYTSGASMISGAAGEILKLGRDDGIALSQFIFANELQPIPEPETWALLICGAMTAAFLAWRRSGSPSRRTWTMSDRRRNNCSPADRR